jgi:hypothetical protein
VSALLRLLPLLLPFVLAEARTEVQGHLRSYGLHIALAVLAGLIGLMGAVMLVGSAFLRLAETMTAAEAAAITGGGLLVVAGLIALIVGLLSRRRVRRPAAQATGGVAAIAEVLAVAEAAITRHARAEAPRFAVIALLAGCVLGASPSLRKTLLDLVSR